MAVNQVSAIFLMPNFKIDIKLKKISYLIKKMDFNDLNQK